MKYYKKEGRKERMKGGKVDLASSIMFFVCHSCHVM